VGHGLRESKATEGYGHLVQYKPALNLYRLPADSSDWGVAAHLNQSDILGNVSCSMIINQYARRGRGAVDSGMYVPSSMWKEPRNVILLGAY
jgi:hypothetical protein